MKKIFIALLVLISVKTFAQVDGNYNYSVGVRGFSLMQMPKVLQQSNTDVYKADWINGGIIRFNDNQMSFRVSGFYLKDNESTFSNKCDNCETALGKTIDWAIKLGFEKNFNYSVLQPYVAFDIGYRENNFTGDISSKNNTSSPYAAIAGKNGVVFSPTIGLKLNIAKQVSFFAESNVDFFYSYERQETILNDAARTRTFAKYNKFEGLLNPVSAGLQIHLVGKN